MIRSEFIKNASTLVTGTVIAQVISIGLSPILSRLYSPHDFGIFGIFMSIASALAVISTLRYEVAIMLPVDDLEALNLSSLSVIISLMFALVVVVLLVIFKLCFREMVTMDPVLDLWLYFLPVMLILAGINQTMGNWFNRTKKYSSIARGRVINSTGINFSVLGLGILKTGPWGLLAGNIFGLLVSDIYLVRQFIKQKMHWHRSVSVTAMKTQAKKYKEFPRSNVPQATVDMLQVNGIVYLLMCFFDSTVIGHYTFSMRVLQAPMWFFGAAVAQVFFKKATETFQQGGDLQRLFRKILGWNLLISAPFFIVLMLFGPRLFSFIFGTRWHEAGVYSQLLALWLLFDFLKAPLAQLPVVVGKMKMMLRLSLLGNLVLVISILYAGLVTKNVKDGFILLSILMSIYISGLLIWIYKVSAIRQEQWLDRNE